MTQRSLIEEILIAATGPIVTAFVGTLLIGLLAKWITRKAQDRREASVIRQQLVAELTEVAGSAALALLAYEYREREHRQWFRSPNKHQSVAQDDLRKQHFESRLRGWVLERRLEFHFGRKSSAAGSWHTTLDGLHLHYLCLTGNLLRSAPDYTNMLKHTGLEEKQLNDSAVMRQVYQDGLKEATYHVLNTRTLTPHGREHGR